MSLADIASDFGAALGVPEPTAQTTYHVAVEPVESTSPTSAFLVAVSADTAPTAGVVRTEKDFELLQSALQTANHDKAFKFGLPKLPPRPRSLFRAGGKSAEQERAAALQAHLAELVTHPEVVQIAAFQAFISAAAAAPAAAPEPGSPLSRARGQRRARERRAHETTGGDRAGGEPIPGSGQEGVDEREAHVDRRRGRGEERRAADPRADRGDGQPRDRRALARRQDGLLHPRPRLHLDVVVRVVHHVHRRRQGRAPPPRLRDLRPRGELHVPGGGLPPDGGRAPRRVAPRRLHQGARLARDGAREAHRLLPGLQVRRPPDGDHGAQLARNSARNSALGNSAQFSDAASVLSWSASSAPSPPSTPTRSTSTTPTSAGSPPSASSRRCRRSRRLPTRRRWASPSSTRTRSSASPPTSST